MSANVSRPLPEKRRAIDPILLSVAIVCAFLFAPLLIAVAVSPGPLFFDRPTAIAVQANHPAFLAPFDSLIAWLGGWIEALAGLFFALLCCALVRRSIRLVIFSLGYSLVYNGINFLVQRPRPTGLAHVFHNIGAYSFPSGHIAFVIWVCTLTMIFFARKLPRPLFYLAWAVALILIILAALSRIAVGAHWPSDVIGGILVGVGWLSLTLSIPRLTRPVFGDARPTYFIFHTQTRAN